MEFLWARKAKLPSLNSPASFSLPFRAVPCSPLQVSHKHSFREQMWYSSRHLRNRSSHRNNWSDLGNITPSTFTFCMHSHYESVLKGSTWSWSRTDLKVITNLTSLNQSKMTYQARNWIKRAVHTTITKETMVSRHRQSSKQSSMFMTSARLMPPMQSHRSSCSLAKGLHAHWLNGHSSCKSWQPRKPGLPAMGRPCSLSEWRSSWLFGGTTSQS